MKNLILPSLALLSIGTTAQASEAKVKKPNVILIMADDLGWGDVGFNGQKIIKTPHLDQMAKDGIVMDRFYSASAVSSPTRASVLTGRHPFRTGIFNANFGILREEEQTLPELLKEQGYKTGHFGKWHLGTLTTTEKDANRGRPGNTKEYNPPALHGYDDAFVTESKVPTWDPMKKPLKAANGHGWSGLKEGDAFTHYGTHYWDIDGKKVTDNLEGDDSRVIMDRVIPFIKDNKKDPFLAVVWFHTPHAPCVAGPEYAAMYKDESVKFQNYAGCVTAMDEQIGRLRAFLKEQKLDENTMIWFCSDNGPENGSAGITAEFRSRKRSLHEGGVRVPGVMVWPSVIKGGEKTSTPVWTCDYMPTIAAATGTSKNLKDISDGIDIMPILTGKQKLRNSPFVLCYGPGTAYQDDNVKVLHYFEDYMAYNIVEDRAENKQLFEDKRIQTGKDAMTKTLESYRASFEGKEYGKKSYDRMQHKWDKFRVKTPAYVYIVNKQ